MPILQGVFPSAWQQLECSVNRAFNRDD